MTLKEAAQSALDVQNACNLSGVAISLVEVCRALRSEAQCTGTDWINQHPIVVLYVDKLASLAGVQWCSDDAHDNYADAYDACIKLASKEG